MARRAGTADLPLHGGHVPKWLADRMTRLGAVISEAIAEAAASSRVAASISVATFTAGRW
jgi:hypothetical protein